MWSVLTSVEEDGRAWLRDFLSLRSTQCLHLVSLPLRRPRWPRCNKAAGEQWRGATGGENPGHLGMEVLVLEKVLARASRHGSACAREGSSTGHGSPCSLGRCLQCAEPWVGLSSLLVLFLSTPPHLLYSLASLSILSLYPWPSAGISRSSPSFPLPLLF